VAKRDSLSFEEQFPLHRHVFDVGALSSDEWLDGLDRETANALWAKSIWADDLLKRAASFREKKDLFGTWKFANKFALYRENNAQMAQRQRKRPIQSNERPEWQGFLDLRLDDAQLEALDTWKPKPTEVWDTVDEMVEAGYRFIISYNRVTKLASCTVMDDDAERKTGGFGLSSADSDGASALKMAIFKHLHVLNGDWTPLLGKPATSRRG